MSTPPCVSPAGAFYQFPRYDLDLPSTEVVAALRTVYGVAVRPGSEFGAQDEGHLRLSYAADAASITEGVRRLAHGLAGLRCTPFHADGESTPAR
ncbi:aminotransferase class I/II-fold pyridoxal phosphate-dependent enzyme [Streptomyces sp. Ag82_G6-1]|uniref:aminotransferase class I/II-fold pyridoxal phosphate-dependent enzyme n=1 Tax=Streptomyces sp. Ag82_G6-1 TaxID=1938853 RepID=UPI0024B7E0F4|nr:aminotransferase class I/II-fold pyridoxal phosphate-dependent enzyme [Streptomyces sp. Ag82_O1-12]